MADDAKARKLAAARKKLKAYQAKEKQNDGASVELEVRGEDELIPEPKPLEAVELIGHVENPADSKSSAPPSSNISVASLSKSNASSFDSESVSINGSHVQKPMPIEHFIPNAVSDLAHSSTIELLINEKASLCAALAHYKADSKEKSLAAEEANVRLQDALKRIEKLERDMLSSQSQNAQLHNNNERLNVTMVQASNEQDHLKQENVELRDHVDELKQALQKGTDQIKLLEDRLKEKECELELNRIRINQISDVASVENDSKVEVLTQTKFMHEQQIRDLQAMVQQLETEREQSNTQYQNYVQHLNKEITSFSERNAQITEENNRLAERERALVEHVGELEKQLQQIISQQSKQSVTNEQQPKESDKKLLTEEDVETRTSELITEKTILAEKVQLQEVQLIELQRLMNEKLESIQQLEERIGNMSDLQTDSTKLLAKVESNSVAASRAVSQNEELKKLLDEVQTKLIQITNDKFELTNLLDAERFGNREIRTNYESMEKQLTMLTEKLHFKDEEMIRLTKENNVLNSRIESLSGGHNGNVHQKDEHIKHDQHDHHHHNHNGSDEHGDECDHSHDHGSEGHDGHAHAENDHHHDHHHSSDDSCDHDHHADGTAEKEHHHHQHGQNCSHEHSHVSENLLLNTENSATSPVIPQSEAMQKLEARFKSLMNDVANLTDEKQRLEHLVLQLQGETDTIGEYIALYQAQRRVLKQREIEKNTQLTKLKAEREDLHNKVVLLNQLVNNLSQQVNLHMTNNNVNLMDQQIAPQTQQTTDSHQPAAVAPEMVLENQLIANSPSQLNSNEIIHAIKNIVADIKNSEATDFDFDIVPALDHCSCCSGKFETI